MSSGLVSGATGVCWAYLSSPSSSSTGGGGDGGADRGHRAGGTAQRRCAGGRITLVVPIALAWAFWHADPMTDRDDFLLWVETALYEAELALHNGDAGPRRAIWSRCDQPERSAWMNRERHREE